MTRNEGVLGSSPSVGFSGFAGVSIMKRRTPADGSTFTRRLRGVGAADSDRRRSSACHSSRLESPRVTSSPKLAGDWVWRLASGLSCARSPCEVLQLPWALVDLRALQRRRSRIAISRPGDARVPSQPGSLPLSRTRTDRTRDVGAILRAGGRLPLVRREGTADRRLRGWYCLIAKATGSSSLRSGARTRRPRAYAADAAVRQSGASVGHPKRARRRHRLGRPRSSDSRTECRKRIPYIHGL
jgi:hypothetical protein